LLSIILAAVYTLNMVQKVFYGEVKKQNILSLSTIDGNVVAALVIVVIIILFLGVYPKPMFELTQGSVDVFMSKIRGLF